MLCVGIDDCDPGMDHSPTIQGLEMTGIFIYLPVPSEIGVSNTIHDWWISTYCTPWKLQVHLTLKKHLTQAIMDPPK